MKNVTFIFGIIGIASGLVFALGPFAFGTPGPSPAFFIAPAILGLLVAVTHWRNILRVRASAPGKARGLLVANLLLLAIFVFAFFYELHRHAGEPRLPYFLVAIALLWCLPFAVNAFYLVFSSWRSKTS
jgi:hypothetical protein